MMDRSPELRAMAGELDPEEYLRLTEEKNPRQPFSAEARELIAERMRESWRKRKAKQQ